MAGRSLAWLLALAAAAMAARRWLDVVQVRGRSMAPTLLPGDRLFVARRRPRAGDIAMTADPRHPQRELIKRVIAVSGGRVTLRGDNPTASTDARTFGSRPITDVGWRALARYWPPRRIGRLAPAPALLRRLDEGGEPACAVPEALIAGD